MGRTGLEPVTSCVSSRKQPSTKPCQRRDLGDPAAPVCTSVCTDLPESDRIDADLAKVVAAWPTLPDPLKAGILAMVKAAGDTSE